MGVVPAPKADIGTAGPTLKPDRGPSKTDAAHNRRAIRGTGPGRSPLAGSPALPADRASCAIPGGRRRARWAHARPGAPGTTAASRRAGSRRCATARTSLTPPTVLASGTKDLAAVEPWEGDVKLTQSATGFAFGHARVACRRDGGPQPAPSRRAGAVLERQAFHRPAPSFFSSWRRLRRWEKSDATPSLRCCNGRGNSRGAPGRLRVRPFSRAGVQ